MLPHVSANTRFARSIETFSQLGGILIAGYRGIGVTPNVFVDELDLRGLGFEGVVAETTGRPAYHPTTMLKIYVYGYVNQIQSSRRLELETARNVEMMWLTGRLTPDFKTIADFRKDNCPAIRSACRQFVALCRSLNLFAHAMVAIDGSRFKAVNSRDRSFSRGSIERRIEQVEASLERYLSALVLP
jgi:transposase